MKIIAFSDLHTHPFRVGPTPAQSRAVLDKILSSAGAELILCGGDLFHAKGSVPTEALNAVMPPLLRPIESKAQLVAIPGNHDMIGQGSNESALHLLSLLPLERGRLFEQPGVFAFRQAIVLCSPYARDLESRLGELAGLRRQVEEAKSRDPRRRLILLIHNYLSYADGSPSVPGEENVTPNWLDQLEEKLDEPLDLVLCGHNHEFFLWRQPGLERRRCVSIGAPMQHSFGDAGSKRGYVEIILGQGEMAVTHVMLEDAPRFYVGAWGTATRPIDFVRVTADRADAARAQGCTVEIIPNPLPPAAPARLAGLDISSDPAAVLRAYVDRSEEAEERRPPLVASGLALLREANPDLAVGGVR